MGHWQIISRTIKTLGKIENAWTHLYNIPAQTGDKAINK